MIQAIPTVYGGFTFRSRLEARWASFLDKVAWPWDYEPIELEGYIPDFLVLFGAPLLLEVKPALDLSGLEPFRGKIERSGWKGASLLVGVNPYLPSVTTPTLGLLCPANSKSWVPCYPLLCSVCHRYSFGSADAGPCQFCQHPAYLVPAASWKLLWGGAHQETQWDPARSRATLATQGYVKVRRASPRKGRRKRAR